MMKNSILLIFLVLFNLNFYAQPPNGNGNRPPQNRQGNQNKEPKKFNAENITGIFYYDTKEVIKKLKIKDDKKKYFVSKFLKNYNSEIREISFSNSKKFKALYVFVDSNRKKRGPQAFDDDNDDEDSDKKGDGMREEIDKIIRPIRNQVHEKEIKLNDNLQSILSEKQFEKWIKYQKNLKDELRPKKPNNQRKSRNDQQRINNGGMRRQ